MTENSIQGSILFKGVRLPLLILIGIAAIRFILLDSYPLIDSTEARFANIARRMVESGDFVTPRYIHGIPYWGKPPLSFWLTALSLKAFGYSEMAARLPSFLSAAGTVYLTFLFSLRFFGREAAFLAAVILSGTGLFFSLSGVVITDIFLTAWITLSLVSFAMAVEGGEGGRRRLWGYLFFAGLGFSLMTKGPIGAVFTLMPVVAWVVWKRRHGDLWRGLPFVSGLLLTAAIAAPWYVLAEIKTPGFLKYYFIGEHLKRFLVPGWEGTLYGHSHLQRKGAIWFFFLAGAMPWVPVLIASAAWLRVRGARVRDLIRDNRLAYLLCWFLTPMLFFTISSNTLYTYVLPSFPAFAVLTSVSVLKAAVPARPWFVSRPVVCAAAVLIPALFIIGTLTVLPEKAAQKSMRDVNAFYEEQNPGPSDELIYYGKMTFSAEYYSNGRAKDITDRPRMRLFQELTDEGRDYYVIKTEILDFFIDLTNNRVRELARFGKYSVVVEK